MGPYDGSAGSLPDHYDGLMKTLFLMVLLSQNGAGDINASFVNTETLAQCQVKQKVIQGIFSTAKLPVLVNRCIKSELRFTEFQHSTSSSTPRHFYRVGVEGERLDIVRMPNWRSCMNAQRQSIVPGKVYCSSSIQKLSE